LVFSIAALVALGACSSRGNDSSAPMAIPATTAHPTPPTTPNAPAATTPSATAVQTTKPGNGCGQPLPTGVALGRTTIRTMTSGAIAREYRLHLPPGLSMAKATAVVLNFHGLGSNAVQQEAYSGLVPVSDREGFILVTPDGTGTTRAWAALASIPTGVDDVLFTKDLLDRIQADLCVDTARVYSTGMSNGAFMSSRLACVLSDRIAAIAPVAGVNFPLEPCGTPVPVLAFHGTIDRTVPFEAGLIFGVLPYAGARTYASDWASYNHCAVSPDVEKISESVARENFSKCSGADVSLFVVKGGGHTWPGASIEIGRPGETTKEISAAEEIWKFFAAHPLSR